METSPSYVVHALPCALILILSAGCASPRSFALPFVPCPPFSLCRATSCSDSQGCENHRRSRRRSAGMHSCRILCPSINPQVAIAQSFTMQKPRHCATYSSRIFDLLFSVESHGDRIAGLDRGDILRFPLAPPFQIPALSQRQGVLPRFFLHARGAALCS